MEIQARKSAYSMFYFRLTLTSACSCLVWVMPPAKIQTLVTCVTVRMTGVVTTVRWRRTCVMISVRYVSKSVTYSLSDEPIVGEMVKLSYLRHNLIKYG